MLHIICPVSHFSDFFWQFPKCHCIDFGACSPSYVVMKHIFAIAALAGFIALTPAVSQAQTNAPAAGSADAKEQATIDKHVKPIFEALKLNDAAKEAKVREVVAAQIEDLRAFHGTNDAQIKALWADFNQARSAKDVTNANTALEKIDAVYATYKPQHDAFVSGLASVLTPEQVEKVKDAETINKVQVTYDVYLQIFPTLTDAQKAVVLQDLKDAREQAIDCEAMPEKSAFFKKYKIIIEDNYLTSQGYHPAQARKDFGAKQKAAKADAATKTADQ